MVIPKESVTFIRSPSLYRIPDQYMCISLLVEACASLVLMSLLILSVPCCLTCLFLAYPPFQATGTDWVYCPFLGKHPIKGVGPASQEVQAVLVCTQPQGPGVCKPYMQLCVYSVSEVMTCQEKGAQRSQFSISPLAMQNSLLSARYVYI